MGFETILFAAFTGLKALSQMSQAQKQADAVAENARLKNKALKDEAELKVKERAKELRYKAARQTVSFLNSGVEVGQGTPQTIIGETFQTGKEDIKNISSNYQNTIKSVTSQANSQADNIISQGRSQAIGTIAGGFANTSGMFGGGSGVNLDPVASTPTVGALDNMGYNMTAQIGNLEDSLNIGFE